MIADQKPFRCRNKVTDLDVCGSNLSITVELSFSCPLQASCLQAWEPQFVLLSASLGRKSRGPSERAKLVGNLAKN